MADLDRWHEIHDAYVTFFGDDHRPAAVDHADRPHHGPVVVRVPGPPVTIMRNPWPSYSDTGFPAYRRALERALLYGSSPGGSWGTH